MLYTCAVGWIWGVFVCFIFYFKKAFFCNFDCDCDNIAHKKDKKPHKSNLRGICKPFNGSCLFVFVSMCAYTLIAFFDAHSEIFWKKKTKNKKINFTKIVFFLPFCVLWHWKWCVSNWMIMQPLNAFILIFIGHYIIIHFNKIDFSSVII